MTSGFYLSIGKQGEGKTALITKLTVDEFSKNKRVIYSNYTLNNIPFTKITFDTSINPNALSILDMLDDDPDIFNNAIILLDEIHIYLDSLDFMRKNNRRLQTFFSQLRKRNILLLATTQYVMNVDIRIRRQCSNVFEMKSLKNGIYRVTTHVIDGYYTEMVSMYDVDLRPYYNHYDTNEIIR